MYFNTVNIGFPSFFLENSILHKMKMYSQVNYFCISYSYKVKFNLFSIHNVLYVNNSQCCPLKNECAYIINNKF